MLLKVELTDAQYACLERLLLEDMPIASAWSRGRSMHEEILFVLHEAYGAALREPAA